MLKILFDWSLFVSLALTIPFGVIGCAGDGGSLPPIGGFSSATDLEWDDLDAAVSYVASREELALVESSTVRDGVEGGVGHAVRRYLLVDVRDRPIEIRFRADSRALEGLRGASATRAGSVVVRVGRFGDDQRERALVSALLERLSALVVID